MSIDPVHVLELARKWADEAEVFFAETEDTPVDFEANRLKLLQSRSTRGIGLRVIKHGRIGFASSSRPDDAETLVEIALELAPFGAEARFHLPPASAYPSVDVYDPAVAAVPVEEMVQLGQRMVDGVLTSAPDVLCDAEVRKVSQRLRLLNSAGVDVEYRKSYFRAGVSAQRVRGTDMLWVGDGEVSSRPITETDTILSHTLTQLERARENVPVRTRQMPVIFTPDGVAGTLMLPLSIAFSGKNVLQGSSPLVNSLGQQMYDERLKIVDDPLIPWRPGSRMADDEGLPARRVTLVENGVVRSFLYDLQTAGQAGTESTASAHRAVPTQPAIASSAIVITPGTVSFDDLVAGIDEGIVVEHVIGASQGNVMGGEFSGNVVLGYKIEGGTITGRVKNTMVAGNAHTLFKRIGALGSDARWMGSGLYTPSIMFEQVSVASTE